MKSKSRLALETENVAQALYAVANEHCTEEAHDSEARPAQRGIAER